jgi:hypothetical protein
MTDNSRGRTKSECARIENTLLGVEEPVGLGGRGDREELLDLRPTDQNRNYFIFSPPFSSSSLSEGIARSFSLSLVINSK